MVASPLNYANVGATSLFTTAGDLVKWLDNFREAKVGGPAAIARMQERGILIRWLFVTGQEAINARAQH